MTDSLTEVFSEGAGLTASDSAGEAEILLIGLRKVVHLTTSLADHARVEDLSKKLDGHRQAIESLTKAGASVPEVLRDAFATLQHEAREAEAAVELLLSLKTGLLELVADVENAIPPRPDHRRSRVSGGRETRKRTLTTAPQGFIFCGSQYSARTWIDVLRQLLQRLLERHEPEFDRILSVRGPKKVFFSRDQSEFHRGELIPGTLVYMELMQRANGIAGLCLALVKLFGYSETDFEILEVD